MSVTHKSLSDRIDELLIRLSVSHRVDELVRDTCDCLPIICTEIFSDRERTIDNADAVKELMHLLPEVCSVKELLVTLLLQMDTFKEDSVYFALLPPIRDCIRKLPAKRHLSLSTALETIGAHIDTVVLPDEPAECVELLSPAVGDVEKRLSSTVAALFDFVEPFARDVSWMNRLIGRHDQIALDREVTDLTRCLLKVLGGSLGRVDLRNKSCVDLKTKYDPFNDCGKCAERCTRLLIQIHPDVVKLISDSIAVNDSEERRNLELLRRRRQNAELSTLDDDEIDGYSRSSNDRMSDIGLAVLAYLVFGEQVGLEHVPQVYSHEFFVLFSFRHVLRLLEDVRSATKIKGILLAQSLTDRLDLKTLEPRMFELEEMTELIEVIISTMISARVKEVCQAAVKLLSALLKAFDSDGRCRFLEFLLSNNRNASVRGHVIVLVKDEIDELLRGMCIENSASCDAVRTLLQRLQSHIFKVPREGFRSQLLTDEREHVLSALNLLRYLLIRDSPNKNFTGIWNMVTQLDDSYLRLLRDAVPLAVRDVHAELNNLRQTSAVSDSQDHGTISFSVDDRTFDDLSPEQRVQMYNMSLVNLDMFDSVLTRVEELARLPVLNDL